EVIEFRDFYEAPTTVAATGSASEGTATKKGRTVALTTEDMQKRKNDVKARTTLLFGLPDERQLRFISISQDTTCAYIASQSSVSQIKIEDITQIDEDDIEEMDIKWNMALLSMRADRF
nr:ribonuclease H-like domain-containing protein [Tanacetum cinerariifolium]